MKIGKNSVVSFHFTLKNDKGEVLESSAGHEPLLYMHGTQGIVPGLEEALEGKEAGAKLSVSLTPEKAYGARDERLVQKIPKKQFPATAKLETGMQFRADTPAGPRVFTITGIEGNDVTVDGNHELAGLALQFDIEITEVREASKEEIAHGHAHGPGGHHHH